MAEEKRIVLYDKDLELEAYLFRGVKQAFPSHFHEYYFIGFIEQGLQLAICRGTERLSRAGDLLLFNPGEVHACRPVDDRPLDYRCLNVPVETMERAVEEITGLALRPWFAQNIVSGSELVTPLKALHAMVMDGETGFDKEEAFLLLVEQLLAEYASGAPVPPPAGGGEVERVCSYLAGHYADRVTLEELAALAGWNKYRLVRAFTRERGITPYSYLMTLRVGAAKKRLEEGASPLEAALETGFADQSHFSNQFKKLIGLTPRQYANIFTREGPDHGRA